MKFQIPKGPFVRSDTILPSSEEPEDPPSVTGSDVSLLDYESDDNNSFCGLSSSSACVSSPAPQASPRIPLQWEFKGLTLWLEFEEYNQDLSQAIEYAVKRYGTERIPVPHATAIYGMTHLSPHEAILKLEQIPCVLKDWNNMLEKPIGFTCDIAQEGKPGQVCNISWAELTYPTNHGHEEAMDALYDLFDMPTLRQGPWRPHISLAYDNPEDPVLNVQDTFTYVSRNPSLLKQRRIKAISLWSTMGKMADWHCLDRVHLSQNDDDKNDKH